MRPHFFLLALLVAGCSEDPTSVGIGLLPPGDFPDFSDTTLTATAISTSKAIPLTLRQDLDVPNWRPEHLFVGGIQQLTAGSFIRFEQLPDSLTGITVTAADLILVPTVASGDTTLTPVFTAHRALRRWNGDSLSYDSLTMQPGVYVGDILPPGIGTGTIDTGAVTLPLDTALVRQWFVTTIDTGTTNLGVFLRGAANGVIRGYGAFANLTPAKRPRLRVEYLRNDVPGTIVLSGGSSRFLAQLPSTDFDPAKMYVQAGVAYRGTVVFDLSMLPRPASVSECVLELTPDSVASARDNRPDSLYAFYMETNDRVEKLSAVPSGRDTVNGRSVYTFSVPHFAQQWLRTGTSPRVVIAAFAENTTFGRFVIHGATASVDLRPRLIVTYSKATATYGRQP